MPKLPNRARPHASAFAIYIQHLMHEALLDVKKFAMSLDLIPIALVFDGVYVLAKDEDHLRAASEKVAETALKEKGLMLALKAC